MKRAGLKRIVPRHGDEMHRWTIMSQADVTTLVTQDLVTELFQNAYQTVRRYVTRQLHAASSGINSSLT